MPIIFSDNKSALALAKSSIITGKSKHFLVRAHIIKEYADSLCYCPTGVNKSDGLTKGGVGEDKLLQLFYTHDENGKFPEDINNADATMTLIVSDEYLNGTAHVSYCAVL